MRTLREASFRSRILLLMPFSVLVKVDWLKILPIFELEIQHINQLDLLEKYSRILSIYKILAFSKRKRFLTLQTLKSVKLIKRS